jgi:hypothetical protein
LYATEETAFTEAMNFEMGPSVKTFDWLPSLPMGICLRAYPWVIVAGYFLSFHLIRRFRNFVRSTNSNEFDDPGFPMNLMLFQPSQGESRYVSTFLTLILAFMPLVAASVSYYLRWDLADQMQSLADGMSKQLETMNQDEGFNLALDSLKSAIQQVEPSWIEFAALLIAVAISLAVAIQLEKAKTQVSANKLMPAG